MLHALLPLLDLFSSRALLELRIATILGSQTIFGSTIYTNWWLGPYGVIQFLNGVIAANDSNVHFGKGPN